ncbi:MAG: hypothetical protein SGARI_006597 [Bacillariaceae sp.]
MNALRLRSLLTAVVQRPPLLATQRLTLLRNKSTLVRQTVKPHNQEPVSTAVYTMVLLGGCGAAAALDRMGFSHHDLMPSNQKTKMSRRDTLLDGVRGTNWK